MDRTTWICKIFLIKWKKTPFFCAEGNIEKHAQTQPHRYLEHICRFRIKQICSFSLFQALNRIKFLLYSPVSRQNRREEENPISQRYTKVRRCSYPMCLTLLAELLLKWNLCWHLCFSMFLFFLSPDASCVRQIKAWRDFNTLQRLFTLPITELLSFCVIKHKQQKNKKGWRRSWNKNICCWSDIK